MRLKTIFMGLELGVWIRRRPIRYGLLISSRIGLYVLSTSAPNLVTEVATLAAEFLRIGDGIITLFMIQSLPRDAMFSLLG